MPTHWATKDLENIDFQKIRYYLSQGQKPKRTWDEVPDDIKKTFERLGIPEQERKFLAGVEAQFDSEAAYSNIKEIVAKQGVIFVNSTEGLREHPELFKKFFGKVIPTGDNKFSALNSAVFSGGSFIYVPPGVKVAQPLQAYFRINAENFGQFERTLIIADEGSEVVYMEGCTAPKFSTSTLHSAVVELVALKGAKIQYITVQNWANNVFNLVTKRGIAHEDAEIKWIDCNIGSRLTMKYPGVVLKGERARGEVISIALANDGQHQDTGAKMIHAANNTTSNIVAKSISVGQGRSTYRGVVHIPKHLKGCKNNTECDALLINTNSRTDTYPAISVRGDKNATQHEASVSKVCGRHDLLHAAARPHRRPSHEPRREWFHQRPRAPIPDGIQRRAQTPHRPRNGRQRRLSPTSIAPPPCPHPLSLLPPTSLAASPPKPLPRTSPAFLPRCPRGGSPASAPPTRNSPHSPSDAHR